MIEKGVSYQNEKLSRIENLAWALGKYYELKGKQDVNEYENLIRVEMQSIPIMKEDIEKYKLDKHLIKLKDNDISRLKQISNYEWFKDNKPWQKQFSLMKKMGAKAEIQALSARGISFISEKYLPEKIKKKDFID